MLQMTASPPDLLHQLPLLLAKERSRPCVVKRPAPTDIDEHEGDKAAWHELEEELGLHVRVHQASGSTAQVLHLQLLSLVLLYATTARAKPCGRQVAHVVPKLSLVHPVRLPGTQGYGVVH